MKLKIRRCWFYQICRILKTDTGYNYEYVETGAYFQKTY